MICECVVNFNPGLSLLVFLHNSTDIASILNGAKSIMYNSVLNFLLKHSLMDSLLTVGC